MERAQRGTHYRTVRSFVLREGRVTSAQERALHTLWPSFGVSMPKPGQRLDLNHLFGNHHPVVLDIGFGDGAAIAETALAQPDINLFGVEVHRPGIGRLLMQLEARQISNVRVMCHDAVEVLNGALAPCSLQGVRLFFPDPWPKKKHHKRRIVQPRFLELLQRALAPGGRFHFATDWQDYAEQVLTLVDADARFDNTAGAGRFTPRPKNRPVTKFECRGQAKGHQTWDLIYRRR